MKLSQGDSVLIRGKIVSVDGNQATVSLSSTDFAIVPLSAIIEPAASIVRERVTGMKLRVKTSR